MHKYINIQEINDSVEFLQKWIATDLSELDGDCISDYAKFVLSGHKHINTAIETMLNSVDVTRGYAE